MSHEIAENPILWIEMKMHLGLAGKKQTRPVSVWMICDHSEKIVVPGRSCHLTCSVQLLSDQSLSETPMKRSLLDVKSHVKLWLIAYAVRKFLLASNLNPFQERFGVGLVFLFTWELGTNTVSIMSILISPITNVDFIHSLGKSPERGCMDWYWHNTLMVNVAHLLLKKS